MRGKATVAREQLYYSRKFIGGKPFKFIDFTNGAGSAIKNEAELAEDGQEEREEQRLDSPDILAIKGLGQFQRFEAASAIRNLIENWHVSDFHINAARVSPEAGVADHLSTEGENLALVAQYLYENHRKKFDAILDAMKRRVPGVANVEATETTDGRIVLRFRDGSFRDPFIARFVSDGTIKMFAYLVLLHDPKPRDLLCVEEPENQLYPTLMPELADEFQSYAQRGGQVFVSTHSPDFLNSVEPKSLFVLTKDEWGYANSQCGRFSADQGALRRRRQAGLAVAPTHVSGRRSAMNDIVVFAEETSGRIIAEALAHTLGIGSRTRCIEHQGKSDLEKSFPKKIRTWGRQARFIVMRDNNGAICVDKKAMLAQRVPAEAADRVKIRLVLQELESWFIGDPHALHEANLIDANLAARWPFKAKFRKPDSIRHAKEALHKQIEGRGQIELARLVGPCLRPERNRSPSFHAFVAALRWAAAA